MKMPVFLSSDMHTEQMLLLRENVIRLFARDPEWNPFELIALDDTASAMEPPPETNSIPDRGLFLLILGDDSEPVRREIAQAKARNNEFFLFFDKALWNREEAAQFAEDLGLAKPWRGFYRSSDDLCAGIKKAFADHAVNCMRMYEKYPSEDILTLAHVLTAQRKWDEAMVKIKGLIERDPSNFGANFLAGYVCHQGMNRRREACEYYRECVRLQPEDLRARFNLAVALNNSGRPCEAVREYDDAERILAKCSTEDSPVIKAKLCLFRAQAGARCGDESHPKERVAEDFHRAKNLLVEFRHIPKAAYWLNQLEASRKDIANSLGGDELLDSSVDPREYEDLDSSCECEGSPEPPDYLRQS